MGSWLSGKGVAGGKETTAKNQRKSIDLHGRHFEYTRKVFHNQDVEFGTFHHLKDYMWVYSLKDYANSLPSNDSIFVYC